VIQQKNTPTKRSDRSQRRRMPLPSSGNKGQSAAQGSLSEPPTIAWRRRESPLSKEASGRLFDSAKNSKNREGPRRIKKSGAAGNRLDCVCRNVIVEMWDVADFAIEWREGIRWGENPFKEGRPCESGDTHRIGTTPTNKEANTPNEQAKESWRAKKKSVAGERKEAPIASSASGYRPESRWLFKRARFPSERSWRIGEKACWRGSDLERRKGLEGE